VDVVIALLERGALPDLENNEHHTALTISCRDGALLGIQALVQYGAFVNYETKNGKTALIWAAEKGHPDVVASLCADCGAKVRKPQTQVCLTNSPPPATVSHG
jgi:ankyrin repeat protein